ncbi:hypothetical protein [Streptomyces marispadix]|uniref:hypothetical protein n=1 Tax=Streptomyces marispadix TaxID=2922868 RepID=UPI002402CBA2|nr:hypothetical protein [Streptomyces marispadix]
MRPSHDAPSAHSSPTPIYDALYAEYGRLFRTLPGDRSGEEELRFQGFGTVHGTGTGNWGDEGRHGDDWSAHDALPRHGSRVPALPPAPRDGQSPRY